MPAPPDLVVIGSLLWDIVGRTAVRLGRGGDVAGRIERRPGGVAMNVAATAARFGLRPALLSAVGQDADGEGLLAAAEGMGVDTRHVRRLARWPTDRYMAIEDAGGLLGAIADARTLEAAGAAILAPLSDGTLTERGAGWPGLLVLDGNLTGAVLDQIATSGAFASADLRIIPAGPGKATRLLGVLRLPNATLYLNRHEAELLCGTGFDGAGNAALGLLALGAARVLVTDGARPAVDAVAGGPLLQALPPSVKVARVTGAGDTFVGAHLAAEHRRLPRDEALHIALAAAADHISGETPA